MAISSIFTEMRNSLTPASGKDEMKSVHAFFAWFGGTMIETLKKCEISVQQSRATQGGLVFTVVLMSSILAGVVWGRVFQSMAAGIGIGILWCLVMTMLDRNLLASMNGGSNKSRSKTALLLVMRLAVAFVISHLNAQFAQLMIFEPEIQTVLSEQKLEQLRQADGSLRQARDAYNLWRNGERTRIDTARAATIAARAEFVGEISGRGGSGRPGYAQIARTKEQEVTAAETALAGEEAAFTEATTSGTEAQNLRDAERRRAERQAQIRDKRTYGLVERLRALEQVAGNNPLVYWMYALFLLLEMLAFLVKMMSSTDEYDRRVDRQGRELEIRFQTEEIEEKQWIRQLIVDEAQRDADAAGDLARSAGDRANALMATLGHQQAENSAIIGSLVGIQGHEKELKDAGTPRPVRERFVSDAHSNVTDIRFRQR